VASFLPLASLVFLPENPGCIDVGALTLLRAAAEQNYKSLAVPSKINSIAWPKIQA
jgi:hypothetical protein